MLIYKYVTPERIDILENGCVRFTQSEHLNDPFEIRPNFKIYERYLRDMLRNDFSSLMKESGYTFIEQESQIQRSVRKGITDLRNDINVDYLVLSLTKNRNNLTMWSHYTNKYQGFVLGFDADSPFFLKGDLGSITPLRNVTYSDKRPIVPKTEEINHTIIEILLTKSSHWSYEEELRMLAKSSAADKKIQIGTEEIFLFNFPQDSLREIIFGYEMTPELKQKIFKLVQNHYPNVELFESRLSDTDYDLEIKSYRNH